MLGVRAEMPKALKLLLYILMNATQRLEKQGCAVFSKAGCLKFYRQL